MIFEKHSLSLILRNQAGALLRHLWWVRLLHKAHDENKDWQRTVIDQYGDMFSVLDRDEFPTLLHGVNTHGVMGSGIARQFKDRWREMYAEYQQFCANGLISPGTIHVWTKKPLRIINAATQDLPGPNAKYAWVESSLSLAATVASMMKAPVISMPEVGCGIGGLEWEKVSNIIKEIESKHDTVTFEVWHYIDKSTPSVVD